MKACDRFQDSHVASVVLKALLTGLDLKIADRVYCMSTDYRVCERRGEHLLPLNFGNFSVDEFVSFCGQIPMDDWVTISAESTMNSDEFKKIMKGH